MSSSRLLRIAAIFLFSFGAVCAANPYDAWTNGPSTDPNFFMIGVWYQTPTTARITGYAAMNINTFMYLDPAGTTQADLDRLTANHMYTVMPQSTLGLANVSNKTIIGWFNTTDEPDNAQPNGSGGYTDPILPQTLINTYNTIKANDPTRPVEMNLGQGVAWDGWVGRGTRTNHPEDYAASTTFVWNGTTYHQGYLAGSDIAAFDFYPMNATNPAVAGRIDLVGYGVDRLKAWSAPGHPVWNYIETTNIDNTDSSPGPTTAQIKAEVWLSLVHGSNGIIYFAHTITPFKEPALLLDPVLNPAVTAINTQIKALAPVLNSDTVLAATINTGGNLDMHLDFMGKVYGGNEYLFAVADQNSNGTALFFDPNMANLSGIVDVLGESRQINMVNGRFTDAFGASGVHLYELLGITGFTPNLVARTPEPGTLSVFGLGAMGLMRRVRRRMR